MRVLRSPTDQERSKSPLPSITRLRPTIPVNIRPKLPLSNKSRTLSSDERALLLLNHPTSFGSHDEINAIQQQPIRKSKKIAVSFMQASVQRNAKQFASNVKNVRIHLPVQLNRNPRLQKRGSQDDHREFLQTESRDDELGHLLCSYDDHGVFTINDETMEDERESYPALTTMEVVDFGGFDVVRESCQEEREVDDTTETVSVSDASVEASINSGAASVESEANELKDELDLMVEKLESKSYTMIYEQICRGYVRDDEEENKEKEEISISSASTKSESIRSAKQLSNADDNDVSVSSYIGSLKSAKEMNDAIQLTVTEENSVASKGHHSRISSSSNSSCLHGVYFVKTDESSVLIEEESSQSLLGEANEIDSSDGGSDEFQGDVTLNVVLEIDTAKDQGAQISPIEDVSVLTPELPMKAPVPSMAFSVDAASQSRSFLVSQSPLAVTPTEHGDEILISNHSSMVDSKASEEVSHVISIDLEPKFMRNMASSDKQVNSLAVAPALASIGSEDSTSSRASSDLWSGLEVHQFDDEVFNEAEEIFGEKEEDGSVFMSRDDWKPEDDSESTCSQPFGCCTVNVDIKRSLVGATEEEKSQIKSRHVDYHETTNILDEISDGESDIVSSQSTITNNSAKSSGGGKSSQIASFNLSDRFIVLADFAESNSGDDSSDGFDDTNGSLNGDDEKNEVIDVQVIEDSDSIAASSGGADNISIGESDVSPVQIEPNGSSSAASDVGAANFDTLRDFWTQEWAEATTDEKTEDVDFNEASSTTESESHGLGGIIDFSNFERYKMELDSPSCISHSRLETVEEEVAEEIDDDSTIDAAPKVSSAANLVEESDDSTGIISSASQIGEVDIRVAIVEEERSDSHMATEITQDAAVAREEGLLVSKMRPAENFVSVAQTLALDENIHLFVDDATSRSLQQSNVVFHKSRYTKKRYVQVKKWAVVKAKAKKASKFSIEVRRELRSKDVDKAEADSIRSDPSPPEVDGVVLKALDLLAKRQIASLAEIPEDEEVSALNDQLSVKDEPSSPFLAKPEALSRHSPIPSTMLCGSIDACNNMHVTTPVYYESEECKDRLGQLRNHLSPRAKETRLGGYTSESSILISEQSVAEEEPQKDEPIAREKVVEVEKTQEEPVVEEEHELIVVLEKEEKQVDLIEEDVAREEYTEGHPTTEETSVIENSVQDEPAGVDVVAVDKSKAETQTEIIKPTFMQFDDIHPPQLGTLTQKLYYTNTELAETLAMTQSELEVASNKVKVLASERDELLKAVKKQVKFLGSRGVESNRIFSKSVTAKGVGSNCSSAATKSVAEKEIEELLEWLGEDNELIEI